MARANAEFLEHHLNTRHGVEYHCPAADTYIPSGGPSQPENAYPRPEDTGGMEELLKVAMDARVMLRLNLDTSDGLSNGARGNVYDVTFRDDEVHQIWVQFDKGGQRWRDAHQHPDAVAIERHTARFFGRDGQAVQRRQFPLRLAWAETIHKSQGQTHKGGVHACLDSTVRTPAQAYVALSRSPTLELLTLSAFNPKCLIVPTGADWAINELHRAFFERPGPANIEQKALYKQLFTPEKPPVFYDQQKEKMGDPDFAEYRQYLNAAADGEGVAEPVWTCPFCGYEALNKYLEKKHIKECRKARKPRTGKNARKTKMPAGSLQPRPIAAKQPMPKRPRVAVQEPPIHSAPSKTASVVPPPGPAPAPAPAHWRGYFEQQIEARCGMHALNNLVGEQLFHTEDLMFAMETFLAENAAVGDSPSDHVAEGGWYSAEVLATALQTVAMQRFDKVMWEMPLMPVSRADQVRAALGVLQHRPGPLAHWVALRAQDGQIFELDSVRASPQPLEDVEVQALLARFPASYAVQLA